eukprot:scaffold5051_cov51-Phaeocystis_antarctica.AAC.1
MTTREARPCTFTRARGFRVAPSAPHSSAPRRAPSRHPVGGRPRVGHPSLSMSVLSSLSMAWCIVPPTSTTAASMMKLACRRRGVERSSFSYRSRGTGARTLGRRGWTARATVRE